MKIGYARVSTYSQSLDLQLQKLKVAGCEKIYKEKVSDAKDIRKEFQSMMKFDQEGDQIVVTRLDRLSRSLLKLQKTSRALENKMIDLVILEQSVDTFSPTENLLFNIIGTVTEFEREMIHQRAAEGRKKAREKGVIFSMPRKLSKKDMESIAGMLQMGSTKKEL